MTRPRVLFLVNDPAFFVSHRLALAVAARAEGYDVHVATGAGAAIAAIESAGFVHTALPLSRSGASPVTELRAILAIRRLFQRTRPDLVHLVTIKPVLYGGIVARVAGVPRVVAAISGFGFVFLSTGWRASTRRWLVVRAYRIALRHRRVTMIFQNPQDRAEMLRHVGLPDTNTVLIPGSGVDIQAFATPARHRDAPVVVMASRLLIDKGVREYVAAATLLRERGYTAQFILAGAPDPDNPTSISHAELDEWRRSGAVELIGVCTDVPKLFARTDIVVLPSYREGLPKVLAEAAAAGCAVVTTDVPGCRDAIVPDESGLLVPVGNAERLADAIAVLLADPELRAQMGAAGRELARERFSLDAIVAQHVRVYAELLRDA